MGSVCLFSCLVPRCLYYACKRISSLQCERLCSVYVCLGAMSSSVPTLCRSSCHCRDSLFPVWPQAVQLATTSTFEFKVNIRFYYPFGLRFFPRDKIPCGNCSFHPVGMTARVVCKNKK